MKNMFEQTNIASASLASGTKQLGGGSGEGEVTLRIHR